jgi:hypothetical protein
VCCLDFPELSHFLVQNTFFKTRTQVAGAVGSHPISVFYSVYRVRFFDESGFPDCAVK